MRNDFLKGFNVLKWNVFQLILGWNARTGCVYEIIVWFEHKNGNYPSDPSKIHCKKIKWVFFWFTSYFRKRRLCKTSRNLSSKIRIRIILLIEFGVTLAAINQNKKRFFSALTFLRCVVVEVDYLFIRSNPTRTIKSNLLLHCIQL